jgi:large subunit ribosomal protein L49
VCLNNTYLLIVQLTNLQIEPVTSSKPTAPAQAPPAPPTTPQEASRAADLAAVEANTESDSAQPPEPKPELPSQHGKSDRKTKKVDDVLPTGAPAMTADTAKALKKAPASGQISTLNTKADDIPKPSKSTSKPNTESSLKKSPSKAKAKTPSTVSIELPPPKYHVSRSANKNLPIYTDYKRGGNLHLTTIRKITGDLSALRDELRVYLNKKNEDVKINALTQHVIVKGHHSGLVKSFLEQRGF